MVCQSCCTSAAAAVSQIEGGGLCKVWPGRSWARRLSGLARHASRAGTVVVARRARREAQDLGEDLGIAHDDIVAAREAHGLDAILARGFLVRLHEHAILGEQARDGARFEGVLG